MNSLAHRREGALLAISALAVLAMVSACARPPQQTAAPQAAEATAAVAAPAPQAKELEGEISILFWIDVNAAEKGLSENKPWEATYHLIKEWSALHPKVKINWISDPDLDRYSRARTTLMAGTAADLVSLYANNDVVKGNQDLFYNLAPHLEQPNPYGKAPTWREEFYYGIETINHDQASEIPTGEIFFAGNSTPSNIGQVVLYYNKDLLKAAGIEKPPTTYAELMDDLKKLKDAGIEGWEFDASGTNCCSLGWQPGEFIEQINLPLIQQIQRSWGIPDKFCSIKQEHLVWAVKKGLLKATNPEYLEGLRLLKEMVPYFPKDWQAPQAGVDAFLTGRVAFREQGFWNLNQYANSPERKFEFGSIIMPAITKDTSPFSVREPGKVGRWGGDNGGEVGNSFYIPKTTVDRGNLPIVLDILQYLTARPQNDTWCKSQWPPCLEKGQKITDVVTDPIKQEQLRGFFDPPQTLETASRCFGNGSIDGDTFQRLTVQYLSGKIELEPLGKELQSAWERKADQLIQENPTWAVDKWPEPAQ